MRLLTYSHDSFGLGHLRRTFAISREVAQKCPGSNVLSLVGSPMGHVYFDMESRNHDYVKLPAIQKTSKGEYEPRHLTSSMEEVTSLRAEIIGATLYQFKPNLVLVDKTPRGVGDELVSGLETYRHLHPEARIVLSLRDVLDEPNLIRRQWNQPDFVSWITGIYNEIWVWGEQKVFDTLEEYQFPESLRRITKFMGYLPPEPVCADSTRLRAKAGVAEKGQRLLLVTAGGGGDGIQFFRDVLPGITASSEGQLQVLLVAGPLMSEPDFEKLKNLVRPLKDKAKVVRFLTHFEDWIRASDAIVCMGGYNTMREIAALGKPTLVIPRTHPRREQEIRASIFSIRGWCHTIHPDQHIPAATQDFCQNLVHDNLAHSATTLGCQGYIRLLQEIENIFPFPDSKKPENCAIG